jgi:hypothetical protein
MRPREETDMELARLRTVYEHPGPYLTVHAEVGRGGEHALDQIDARWTSIRHELERHDLDPSLVEQVGERLRENTHLEGEVRRTIVASGDEVVFDDVQAAHSMWPETVEVADLPDLTGWLRIADQEIPFLLVQVDRTGGDIDFYRALARPRSEHESVEGASYYIRKVPQGDWAQKQFQRGAEELWKKNAREVADAITTLAGQHRPRAILVGGDVRAVQELTDALEASDVPVVRLQSGGRAQGTSQKALWEEVSVVLADLDAHAEKEIADQLVKAAGRDAGAAIGTDAVLDALVRQQVDRLVLDLDEAAAKTVRPSRHEGLVLPEPALGADELPVDRVVVAAAALSSSKLSLLPAELIPALGGAGNAEGVAALLRWTDRETPPEG